MKIFFDKQLTVRESWGASLHLYAKALPIVWSQSIVIGLFTIATTWLGTCTPNQLKIQEMTPTNWVCVFANVFALLLMIYLGGVILYRVYAVGGEQKISLRDSLVFVGRKYSTLTTCVLIILPICLLGFIALIIPGVYLFVSFIMAQPLILFDDKRCFAALKGSFELVWGNWWRTFAVVSPLLFFSYAISLAAQFVSTHGYNCWWCQAIGLAIITTFFYPLFYSCVLIQFGDLKLRYHTKHHDLSI